MIGETKEVELQKKEEEEKSKKFFIPFFFVFNKSLMGVDDNAH